MAKAKVTPPINQSRPNADDKVVARPILLNGQSLPWSFLESNSVKLARPDMLGFRRTLMPAHLSTPHRQCNQGLL